MDEMSDYERYEMYGDAPATISDAIREWVWNVGAEFPDREWLSTDYDTWEKNPYYKGIPGPHPEDETPY